MQARKNRRGYPENFVSKRHLKLYDLQQEAQKIGLENQYLEKIISKYPKPEFRVSRLKHETTADGLKGIRKEEGFRDIYRGSLMWWSLAVGPKEINDAETRLLKETFPDQIKVEDPEQRSLWRFATSPAFKETSRLGSFRFTFPVEVLLTAYREQLCSGAEPVMRVYETVLYQQEVMYVVLVHSPDFNEMFKHYPLLKDDTEAICVYRDGRFIWRAQAMCETHWHELKLEEPDRMEAGRALKNPQFYVWDYFAVALHVENDEVLKFGADKLGNNLTFCEEDNVFYDRKWPYTNLDEARELVSELWPNRPGPLKVEPSLQLSYPVTQFKLVLAGSNEEETMSTEDAILRTAKFTNSELVEVNNLEVRIINTPPLSGLEDAICKSLMIKENKPNKETKHQRKIRLSGPELHAFLLVIKFQNINAEQVKRDVEDFEKKFKNEALRRTMIVFTHQEKIKPDIQNLPQELQEFLSQKVSSRYLAFNNNLDQKNPEKLSHLINMVKKMIKGGD